MADSAQNELRLAVESKFKTLLDMVGKIQGIIVAGPPGIGKSHGIEAELEKQGRKANFVKSGLSPIGLYIKLWETRTEEWTLVIDDSDDILSKREGIDLLKASFDTKVPRRVQWNKQNKDLEGMGIPQQFEYDGHIIFITNIDMQNAKPKSRQLDFDTIISRVFYLDLEMNSIEAKLMRCQIALEDGMLSQVPISDRGMLFEYLTKYAPYFSEVSLRSLIKLNTARKQFPDWELISATALMKNPPADAYGTFEPDGSGAALIIDNTPDGGKEPDDQLIKIDIFDDIHWVQKETAVLVEEEHEKTVNRLTAIDRFFLTKPMSRLDDISGAFGNSEDDERVVLEPIHYKDTLGLSGGQAAELYDFILGIVTVIDDVNEEILGRMVNLYKVADGKWKQAVLAMFVSKGVSVNVVKKG